MIYETYDFSLFRQRFHNMGRTDQFSVRGLSVLFDFLNDSGEDVELDVIALCCEFTECTVKEALRNYDLDSLQELNDNTLVLEIDSDNIVYMNY